MQTEIFAASQTRRQSRRQRLQSIVILALAALLVVGEVARMRLSLPEAERDTMAGAAREPLAAPVRPVLTPEELTRLGVNETGRFPILEYHEIGSPPLHAGAATRRMHRTADAFRRDLARLYAENYRPISLRDYIENKIDVPAGMTPVVLTFDDARESQFRYLPDGSIDPDCALGILQEFTRTHPDFPLKATFFVLTELGFGQKTSTRRSSTQTSLKSETTTQKKLQALQALGCELQNHTLHHDYFGRMADDAVIAEIAAGKASIERLVPGAHVDMLALPGGQHPRSKNNAILLHGEAGGVRYANRAVFDAWGGPAPSPVSVKFDLLRIPRIEPIEDADGLTHWLDYLKTHPKRRYISDGDPATVSVPRSDAAYVNRAALGGTSLRVY